MSLGRSRTVAGARPALVPLINWAASAMSGFGLSYSFAASPSQVIVFQVLVLLRLHHRYPVAASAASNASRGSRPVTDFASIFRRAGNPENLATNTVASAHYTAAKCANT